MNSVEFGDLGDPSDDQRLSMRSRVSMSSTSSPTRTNPASSSSGATFHSGVARCRISVSQDCATRTLGSAFSFVSGYGWTVAGVSPATPKGRVKRTSPSTMSRMSGMPLRNWRVRSRPMPNANPVYTSGSMPAGAQHVRVHHAAAAPLDPAGAALLVREPHVDLGGRLGEREVVRAHTRPGLRAEQGTRERVERAAQVAPWSGPCRPRGPRPGRTPGCAWRRVRRCGTCGPGTPRRSGCRGAASCAPAPARCGCAAPDATLPARCGRCPASCGPDGRAGS